MKTIDKGRLSNNEKGTRDFFGLVRPSYVKFCAELTSDLS
jgi:hypothetical protein